MDWIERFIAGARQRRRRIVLPEGEDARVLAAARRLVDDGVADPIVLGVGDALEHTAEAAGIGLDGIETADPRFDPRLQGYAGTLTSRRDGMTLGMAARLLTRPLYFAGMMVREGA